MPRDAQNSVGAGAHALDEVARRFAATVTARSSAPRPDAAAPPRRRCAPARQACRASSARGSPRGTARRPRRGRCAAQQRRGGLAGAPQRRHDDLVERARRRSASPTRSACMQPEFGERRVDDVEAVAHPFGLAVADEHDLHSGTDRRGSGDAAIAGSVDAVSDPQAGRLVPRPHRPVRVPLLQRRRSGPPTCRSAGSASSTRSAPPTLAHRRFAPGRTAGARRGMAVAAFVVGARVAAHRLGAVRVRVGAAGAIVAFVLRHHRRCATAAAQRRPRPRLRGASAHRAVGGRGRCCASSASCSPRVVLREFDELRQPRAARTRASPIAANDRRRPRR